MNALEERYKIQTPSFSSSLLDAIYRSIDESSGKETKTKRQKNSILEDDETLRRAIRIEKWMDTENRTRNPRKYRQFNSTSSFCGSNRGDSLMPSEPEGQKLRNITMQKSRTGTSLHKQLPVQPPQEREKFCREFITSTKSKATKIYGGLKKLKQPVSPGRRLTDFLNSLFSSKNTKREHDLNSSFEKSRSAKDATTFSRSCLSKQPSRTNSKRSVRFYPLTTSIVYNDSRTYENDRGLMYLNELKNRIAFEDEDGNDDDNISCSSSDLFELENIGAIGVGRGVYKDELPVYGTTSLGTHHAIQNCSI